MNWTPHDFPFLVEKSRRAYLAFAEHLAGTASATGRDDADAAELACRISAETLDVAPMTWLDRQMCELLADTATRVPEWTPAACVPGDEGLIAFERPVIFAPYEHPAGGTTPVPVCMIAWQTEGTQLRLSAWCSRDAVPREVRSPFRDQLTLDELFSITLALDEVVDGHQELTPRGRTSDVTAFKQAANDLHSVAGSLWLLMTQPRIVTERNPATVTVKKKRDGQTIRTPVAVSIRTINSTAQAGSTPTGRTATSRWWVRGHWRQQPWGKGRKLRKPIFIAPHLAGNQDAPIDPRPQVQVIRTGENDTTTEGTQP